MKFEECLKKFDEKVAISMMLNGATLKLIGETLGIKDPRYVSKCFKYKNIKFIRRTFFVNDTYFDNIDSEDKAYILGFLVADGCIKKEKRKKNNSWRISFCNSIDDEETIDLIHLKICPKAKIVIPKKLNNRRKPLYILLWNSEHMAKTLISYGIIPRKTYDKDFKLPENLLQNDDLWRHFIRGFFDGDGHIDSNSLLFVFTSKPFMNLILKWFSNFNYKIYHIQGKTTDYWKVIIPLNIKSKSCIYHFLYDNSNYFLSRKHDSFNTEITYNLKHKVIEIVEHRVEKI